MGRAKNHECPNCKSEHEQECPNGQCQKGDFYTMCGFCRAALRKRQCADKGVKYEDYIRFRNEHHLGGLNPYVVLKAFMWRQDENLDRPHCESKLREFGYSEQNLEKLSLPQMVDAVINDKCAELRDAMELSQIRDDINNYIVF